jgi:hypothetical protein
MRVDPTVLEIMVPHRRDTMGMTCHLMMMMMITRVLRSKLKATALRAMLPEIAPTGSQLTSRVRCEGGRHVWIVIQGSIYFEFEHYV